ncbi:MAG: hypothetical protein NTW65_12020 [Deltaproteobacteria bacterium]|nr:hypothetical protein [Deltaproteobacteria bacterium]
MQKQFLIKKIEEGVNGLLAPDDNPELLGRLPCSPLKDKSYTHQFGQRARRHVEENWNLLKAKTNLEAALFALLKR